MANWRELLTRVRGWLKPEGRLFIHVFTHRTAPYRFDRDDATDWIAQHFFTGGIMPSHGLIRQFPDLFAVEEEWRWSGDALSAHRARLAGQFRRASRRDRRRPCAASMAATPRCGSPLALFFLATAGLFGHPGGSEWGVSHYRMKAAD